MDMDNGDPPKISDEDQLKQKLSSYFVSNPDSGLKFDKGQFWVEKPWGDPSLQFRLEAGDERLIAALNQSYLPPRFTAIWHRDSRDLEVIWGAVNSSREEIGRHFEFRFGGRCLRCEFQEASERLLVMASSTIATIGTATDTNYRNMLLLGSQLRRMARLPQSALTIELTPTSFWVRGIAEWSESFVEGLFRHINFYARYFDRQCPILLIHEPSPSGRGTINTIRYPTGGFPAIISGRPLDPYLLSIWDSAITTNDTFRQFLYHYQILEYVAFYYIQDEILEKVRRVLAAPQTPVRIDEASREIVDAIVMDRTRDEAKFISAIQECVPPETMWREIEANVDRFSEQVEFDGGLLLLPLIKQGWKFEDFKTAWIPRYLACD
jgi:hypothetical protein